MSIPVVKEPDDFKEHLHGATEVCHFCKKSTLYWHENTNNPVCPKCAKTHKVAELPDFGQRVRANKRKARREGVPFESWGK